LGERVRQVGQVGRIGRGENCELDTSCKLAPAGGEVVCKEIIEKTFKYGKKKEN